MKITLQSIEHLAELSKLHLDQNQIEHYTQSLDRIIDYMNKLNEIDVQEVIPTSHVLDLNNIFRDDMAISSMTCEDILINAPDSQDGCFQVPQVVEI